MSSFSHLDPFPDADFLQIRNRLLEDPAFTAFLRQFVPNTAGPILLRWMKSVQNADQFQARVMAPAVDHLLSRSADGFTFSGLDQHAQGRPCLFISNHRDIVLDSLLIGRALFSAGMGIPKMAIGDNLLKTPWLAALFAINKSVVVQRGLSPRALLTASQELSAAIQHSITQEGQNFWIAQQEGRAKDGNDVTSPGLLKMLTLSASQPAWQHWQSLNAVPIAISYEYDPCDVLKAEELAIRAAGSEYVKKPGEDDQSMALGVFGAKGRIHVQFCDPICAENVLTSALSNRETLVVLRQALDQAIHAAFRLMPTHWAAYQTLGGTHAAPYTAEEIQCAQNYLNQRLHLCSSPAARTQLLKMYAQPVENKRFSGDAS
ncbi:MAG: 1-acyl-sn-glycerol-3-phosphate acyltransferase [Acidobacteria bacterium]|nr:1-acyl-sn-glycerol-3-phosphate acyltransferase [Acidobacteriota bacterium]MCB9399094.1 1-acyl-sn-glycerol-3-phosphate acyltransferase [Acidobacteriota bacterium]